MDDVTLFDIAIGLMVLVLGGGLFIMWVVGKLNSDPDEEDSGKSILQAGKAEVLYELSARTSAGGWYVVASNKSWNEIVWYMEKPEHSGKILRLKGSDGTSQVVNGG